MRGRSTDKCGMATKPLHDLHTFVATCRVLAALLKEVSFDCAPKGSSVEVAHPTTDGLLIVKQHLGPAGL